MNILKRLLLLPFKLEKTLFIVSMVLLLGFSIFAYSSLGVLSDLGLLRLTGFPAGQNYLIVFQNDAERRPTGGFISSYAILKFRFGIPLLSFGNVYDDKLIQPDTEFPDETVQSLLAGPYYPGHGFRDGNYAPQWSDAAPELLRLYRLGYPDVEFDGVIAVDFTAFERLVQAVDGVTIGGQDFSKNLFWQVEQSIQDVDLHDPEQLQNRKNILAQLAKGLVKKIIFSPSYYDDISNSLIQSLNEKHVQFYFKDTLLQSRAARHGWTGQWTHGPTDFLAIVEGNYGGMKSSRYLTRDIEYNVELKDTEVKGEQRLAATADLNIGITHRGDAAEPISGYYKGYWRVFAPLGSTLISGQHDRTEEADWWQVWGKKLTFNPGEKREISLRYELPDSVLTDDTYRLRLVRQPGGSADFYRITVKAPAGYLFQQTTSNKQQTAHFDLRENLAIWEGLLTEDIELALKILPDTVPPSLAWQEFVGGLTTIDLRFNEPLDRESVKAATYKLTDLNYRNDRTDDAITVLGARFVPPQNIQLKVSGITEECREWYGLTLDGVADIHGNALTDKQITVVQWVDAAGKSCDPERRL